MDSERYGEIVVCQENSNNYVLAMYDVRGKQDYIFRGRKLKEIVGGSLIIRDIFEDELYPAAKIYKYKSELKKSFGDEADWKQEADWQEIDKQLEGKDSVIFSYKKEYPSTAEDSDRYKFSEDSFKKHLDDGYLGEVVYDGGGNFIVLYKDIETYRGINRIFTRRVLEHTYSLTVLCSCIEGVHFNNYTTLFPDDYDDEKRKEELGDREKLYAANRRREARINPQMPAQVLPFTQVDYANSLPLYSYNYSVKSKLSREASWKNQKFEHNHERDLDTDVLDNLVKEKGSDSWIAVIYIDGNNMGAKIQRLFYDEESSGGLQKSKTVSYEEAVKELRKFSDDIQRDYVDDRIKAIDDALNKKDKENVCKRRVVVYAGDEINIIVNAHDAYDAVKAYFAGMPEKESACAGIAIFKSHMPYADAYHIAEQCCENCKQMMKEYNMGEVNLMDFHYCQGIIGADIEIIREREVGDIISKPWFVSCDEDKNNHNCKDNAGDKGKHEDRIRNYQTGTYPVKDIIDTQMVKQMADNLNTCSRTNIKGLLEHARNSEAELFTELTRMQLRRKKGDNLPDIISLKDVEGNDLAHDKLRKLIYDIVSVYDLWFREEEKKNEAISN